ncbi:hypothetical protein [Microvirga terricola]|uniref:Uncharacterized protein n=1 Tax=Microvirga terricola TaxID=2719797 RepID=A0ABX0VH01_9HYPH|nr:hypothetical protein [Microvirga terricola]NIX78425.1 hypothetical protein [Microvirga terricola]
MTMPVQEDILNEDQLHNAIWPYEEILARYIKDVVADLCLIDANILVSYIHRELHSNLEEMISACSELSFKKGTLCYAHGADMSFEWGGTPTVVLDMEFVHDPATVFFKIVLHGLYVGIAIQRVLLSGEPGNEAIDLGVFSAALADARLSPIQ